HAGATNGIFEEIRRRQQTFSSVFAWSTGGARFSRDTNAPRFVSQILVSGAFFETLGVQPALGRVLTDADDVRGCASPAVVLGHAFWQSEFGGDPRVLGKRIMLGRDAYEIVGVTPREFTGLEVGRRFDVAAPLCSEWLPAGSSNRLESGTEWFLIVMGRLKPGWTLDRASGHLASISPALFAAALPANYPTESIAGYRAFRLEALGAAYGVSSTREQYAAPLWFLQATALLVLLVGCANLANLMLARASAREREVAVRLALGASRGRLVRQLLAESLLLAAAGAALGALLALGLSQFLVSLLSSQGDSAFLDLAPDWRLLAFTAGLAVLTCAVFGLTPAVRATRIAPGAAMKAGGRGLTAGRERFGLRRALVVSQVALSLVLVAGALLFSRSLGNLLTLETGFRQEGLVITAAGFARLNLSPERLLPFRRELLERVRALPGVESAAETSLVPLSGSASGNTVWMEGAGARDGAGSSFSGVGPDYFKTMGTPLVAGRDFDDRDTPTSPKVAIVNEAFARRIAGNANPVGRRFWVEVTPTDPERLYEIVGLVRDTKYRDLREDFGPIAFFPASQDPRPGPHGQFVIRASLPPAAVFAAVKQVFGEVSPEINMSFRVLRTMIQGSLLRERLMATLSGLFGVLALALACIGLYGVMSYSVAGRTHEIGIRLALGAERRDVLWLILREALLLVLIGVAVGVPAVLAAARLAASLLYGLTPSDPVSIGLAALLLLAVAAAAGYLPARRATKVDPMVSLRYE
ncbi:MAG TPA: ABC transporter permease, partial [Blastocatellia bacterium]|nr:ABC transporter permease [Blastocatellia bacterium]